MQKYNVATIRALAAKWPPTDGGIADSVFLKQHTVFMKIQEPL